jgi:hypothetical protein
MSDFQVVPSVFGGWVVRDVAGNAMRHPALPHGAMPPRFKTADKAAAYGRKVLRAIANMSDDELLTELGAA